MIYKKNPLLRGKPLAGDQWLCHLRVQVPLEKGGKGWREGGREEREEQKSSVQQPRKLISPSLLSSDYPTNSDNPSLHMRKKSLRENFRTQWIV